MAGWLTVLEPGSKISRSLLLLGEDMGFTYPAPRYVKCFTANFHASAMGLRHPHHTAEIIQSLLQSLA